jgi:hypothetical protein
MTGIEYCDIAVSNDNTNWTTVLTDYRLTMAPGTVDYNTSDLVELSGSPVCRFIRINCNANYGRDWYGYICGLSEIQVFGSAN